MLTGLFSRMVSNVLNLLLATILRTSDLADHAGVTNDLDLMFVLDGSQSNMMRFNGMKQWVAKVVEGFDIENSTQVGVVQYSHWMQGMDLQIQPYIKTEIELGHYKRAGFEEALMKIQFQGYTTYTAHAINKTVQDFKASSRFGKPATKQVMIVVTDGRSSDADLLPWVTDYARSLGITIFAVGIDGKNASVKELQIIANGEIGNNLRVFRGIDDFTIIDSITGEIKEPFQEPTKEILFVLDGSASLGFDGFERAKELVKIVAQNLTNEHTYFGVVQYSHYYENIPIDQQRYIVTEIAIGEFNDYSNFSTAVDKIRLLGYTTYTGRALEKIRQDFVSTERYGNEGNRQFAVVVTDGKSSDSGLLQPNADALRLLGVTTAAVGIGRAVDVKELRIIATGDINSDERVYYAESTSALPLIVPDLLELFNQY